MASNVDYKLPGNIVFSVLLLGYFTIIYFTFFFSLHNELSLCQITGQSQLHLKTSIFSAFLFHHILTLVSCGSHTMITGSSCLVRSEPSPKTAALL